MCRLKSILLRQNRLCPRRFDCRGRMGCGSSVEEPASTRQPSPSSRAAVAAAWEEDDEGYNVPLKTHAAAAPRPPLRALTSGKITVPPPRPPRETPAQMARRASEKAARVEKHVRIAPAQDKATSSDAVQSTSAKGGSGLENRNRERKTEGRRKEKTWQGVFKWGVNAEGFHTLYALQHFVHTPELGDLLLSNLFRLIRGCHGE